MLKERVLKTDGFTLLEVLISLAIIAITFVAFLNTHATNLNMAREAKDITTAAIIAKEQIERIKVEKKPVTADMEGQTSDEYPGFFWQIKISNTFLEEVEELSITVYKVHNDGVKKSLMELKTYQEKK